MATIVTRAGKGTTLSWAEMDANLNNLNNKVSEIISVKDFGAVGDGVTDDTVAFQNAASTGKAVYIPYGSYKILSVVSGMFYYFADVAFTNISVQNYFGNVKFKNHAWPGFFATWQSGHALAVLTTQRRMISDGATYARAGFASGVTVYHIQPTYYPDGVRIQRNSGDVSTAAANIVINLTQEETIPLVGKTVCAQFHGAKSATFSGGNVTLTIQYSVEQQQPILNADGTYTSGNVVAGTNSFALATTPTSLVSPHYVTGAIPTDVTQVSIVISVPFVGTAGASDYVDIEGVALIEGNGPGVVDIETFTELLNKAKTRIQTSYPYGLARGTNTEQGTFSVIANGTASSWSFAAQISFNPPMATVPMFIFQSPSSSTESRLYDVTGATTINGLAYNLSDTGVMVTNNGVTVDARRYLFHWTAISQF